MIAITFGVQKKNDKNEAHWDDFFSTKNINKKNIKERFQFKTQIFPCFLEKLCRHGEVRKKVIHASDEDFHSSSTPSSRLHEGSSEKTLSHFISHLKSHLKSHELDEGVLTNEISTAKTPKPRRAMMTMRFVLLLWTFLRTSFWVYDYKKTFFLNLDIQFFSFRIIVFILIIQTLSF